MPARFRPNTVTSRLERRRSPEISTAVRISTQEERMMVRVSIFIVRDTTIQVRRGFWRKTRLGFVVWMSIFSGMFRIIQSIGVILSDYGDLVVLVRLRPRGVSVLPAQVAQPH